MRNPEFEKGSKEHQLWHGDSPESVPNDNGYGSKVEYPALPCAAGDCPAKFWDENSRNAHVDFRHSDTMTYASFPAGKTAAPGMRLHDDLAG